MREQWEVRGGWEAAGQEMRKELERRRLAAARLIGDDKTCSCRNGTGERLCKQAVRECGN
jgi:hypothetical protein